MSLYRTGYLHPGYAQSLSEFGVPIELPRSGAWLLKRQIPHSKGWDGIACYPYLVCADWPALKEDLRSIAGELVTFAAVADPFCSLEINDLKHAFPDICIHFKDHYVADLSWTLDKIVSPRHLRNARRALRRVEVEFHTEPLGLLDDWMRLFDQETRRLQLTGIRAFSRASLAQQLALPGSVMSIARHDGHIISAHIQMIHGDIAYAHLAAKVPEARTFGADHALYYSELLYYKDKVRWINWGGDAGLATNGSLSFFKKGWSTNTRPAYFCGRVFNRSLYETICRHIEKTDNYFPMYRKGEFL